MSEDGRTPRTGNVSLNPPTPQDDRWGLFNSDSPETRDSDGTGRLDSFNGRSDQSPDHSA